MTADEVMTLARSEIARIADAERRHAFEAFLVPAAREMRPWSYGPEIFECWRVARIEERRVSVVYVCWKFEDRWVVLPDGQSDLGSDGNWFLLLDDALISCGWDGPLPPDYEIS